MSVQMFNKEKIRGFGDLFIFVPEVEQIIRIAEGSGDNLCEEDIAAGIRDYLYYDQYDLDSEVLEVDGGMVLLEEPVREKYKGLVDSIPDVLDMAYGSSDFEYVVLTQME